jgi:hypothetical protein
MEYGWHHHRWTASIGACVGSPRAAGSAKMVESFLDWNLSVG